VAIRTGECERGAPTFSQALSWGCDGCHRAEAIWVLFHSNLLFLFITLVDFYYSTLAAFELTSYFLKHPEDALEQDTTETLDHGLAERSREEQPVPWGSVA
jgi:hypothetical protein